MKKRYVADIVHVKDLRRQGRNFRVADDGRLSVNGTVSKYINVKLIWRNYVRSN